MVRDAKMQMGKLWQDGVYLYVSKILGEVLAVGFEMLRMQGRFIGPERASLVCPYVYR